LEYRPVVCVQGSVTIFCTTPDTCITSLAEWLRVIPVLFPVPFWACDKVAAINKIMVIEKLIFLFIIKKILILHIKTFK
jgi:hypothetical protein